MRSTRRSGADAFAHGVAASLSFVDPRHGWLPIRAFQRIPSRMRTTDCLVKRNCTGTPAGKKTPVMAV
jgi:hypothetical protein